MTTLKNTSALFSKAKNILQKNAEFVSHLNPKANLSEISYSKLMKGGSEKMFKKIVKYGSENYKNLKDKTPILGKNGSPLELKIMGKTYFRIYKPDFNELYSPKKGFENLFIHPDDEHHFSKGKQQLLTRKGKQKGGMAVGGILSIVGAIIILLIAWGNSKN
jgi:hypothetical protein